MGTHTAPLSPRNGQGVPPARPAAYTSYGIALADVVIRPRAGGGLLATFTQGGKPHVYTVTAGRGGTFLLRTPRNWSFRIHEVVFQGDFDADDRCSCAAHGKRGVCRHLALIRHLLDTEQLPG